VLSFLPFVRKGIAASPLSQDISSLQKQFVNPPDDSRIMMRWWWFGPSVTRDRLEREMVLMKEGGIGGFEVQPVYPLDLDDERKGIRNLRYLSDEFLDAIRFSAAKARELGLRMDLTLGSGWPYGGPHVPISQAASMLRVQRTRVVDGSRRVPVPDLSTGESLIAAFDSSTKQELTDFTDGALWLTEAKSGTEVWFFIASRTGQMVKRPAYGAEGYVMDHYDRASLDNYLKKVADPMMKAVGTNIPYAVFCDSLEVYGADWTGNLLDEFRKRRGYDLKPRLPALVTDVGPETTAIRHDWGQTLTELIEERFFAPMKEWSKAHRTLFRIQGYGVPAAVLSSNKHADLVEGEGHHWKRLSATRWASSANHLYNRPVTSSETWTWLHSPSFRATPLDLKAEADRHFLQGVNQLIGHGWPYTPEGVAYPGWRFYAAGAFNEKNPWWTVMPDLAKYLQRISYLMRQGEPANDVAIYLPNSDAWAHFSAGRIHTIETLRELIGPDVVSTVLDSGFGFDFIDDETLTTLGRVENGALKCGANTYRVVILPGVERMPIATLQQLQELAKVGGAVIATRRLPQTVPGLLVDGASQSRFKELSGNLFEGPSAPGHFVEDEKNGLSPRLTRVFQPDIRLTPPAPDVGFIHRRTEDSDIYFLANTANVPYELKATFRVKGKQPELWNPLSGAISALESNSTPEGVTVTLKLEPYGSRIIVFSNRKLPPAGAITGSAPSPLDLSVGWRVSFGKQGKTTDWATLRSWTVDEATRYFSGVVAYEKNFVAPDVMLQNRFPIRLDFGQGQPVQLEAPRPPAAGAMRAALDGPIRDAAVVFFNGRRIGSIWCPPYSIDVTTAIKKGENSIRIEVANTAINYMAGRGLPDYRLLNLRYGERFQAQNMDKVQPLPSGLLGPVRLIVAQ
jgi:hypothetical protein